MKHDFGISVAVMAVATAHEQPDLHVLPAVKWIWDPSFHYTPSYATDLRKTFERIRRQISPTHQTIVSVRVPVPMDAAWNQHSMHLPQRRRNTEIQSNRPPQARRR